MTEIVDIYTPASPGSLMRTAVLTKPGLYRLARRDAELYSVQITNAGDWGKAWMKTGTGRPVWHQVSTFTGSFWLQAGCEDGIIAELLALHTMCISVNWRERDRRTI